jgi:hypothetical protein
VTPPSLSDAALAALQAARALTLARGQVWWLPKEFVHYRGYPKGRYCLLVAVENAPRGPAAQGYFVAGTTKPATGPAFIVEIGETKLVERTEFDFSLAWPVPASDVAAHGRYIDDLSPRLPDIDQAIRDSTAAELLAVKKVLGL